MTRPYSKTWLFDTLERAGKTAAQFVLGAWGVAVVDPANATIELDWVLGLQAAAAGAVISVVFSVASAPIGGNGTASVVSAPPGPVATEV